MYACVGVWGTRGREKCDAATRETINSVDECASGAGELEVGSFRRGRKIACGCEILMRESCEEVLGGV